MTGDLDDGDTLYEAWHQREAEAYPGIFGTRSDGMKFGLLPEAFRKFGVQSCDPRWTEPGVLIYGPTGRRRSVVYVTSGLSDPWPDAPPGPEAGDEEASGFGFELVLETAAKEQWALEVVTKVLAYAVFEGWKGNRMRLNGRVALNRPLDGRTSALKHLALVRPTRFESSFALDSGFVDMHQIVGITDAELAFSEAHGTSELMETIKRLPGYPIIDPGRGDEA